MGHVPRCLASVIGSQRDWLTREGVWGKSSESRGTTSLLMFSVSGRKLEISGEVLELGKYRLLALCALDSQRLCSDELLVC